MTSHSAGGGRTLELHELQNGQEVPKVDCGKHPTLSPSFLAYDINGLAAQDPVMLGPLPKTQNNRAT